MNKTKIEWCDTTWNPVTGCLHNCEYCYARKIANRYKGCIPNEHRYIRPSDTGTIIELTAPMDKQTKEGDIITAPYPFNFVPTFHKYRLSEPQFCIKPRTIFVCSMADLFGEWVPDEWIAEVFKACEKAPQHRYLFLTKNPDRYANLYEQGKLPREKNMWYGTSTTDTESLYKAMTSLKTIPYSTNIFFSVEPILEDIMACEEKEIMDLLFSLCTKWIIIGAETGNRKGKVVPKKNWIDDICINTDTPIFMKDSLIPIVGEKNMRREFPQEWIEERN